MGKNIGCKIGIVEGGAVGVREGLMLGDTVGEGVDDCVGVPEEGVSVAIVGEMLGWKDGDFVGE